MVGGAVEAQVDAQGNRGPGRVLLAAVEANLASVCQYLFYCRARSQPHEACGKKGGGGSLTLFADLDFNFSKILSDCCLDARPLILAAFLRS
jgi:hypothetical protein